MKYLIVYRSWLGSSKKYAQWLGEELNTEIKKYSQVGSKEIEEANKIILVGGTYAGWLSLGGFIAKYENLLNKKKTFFINVGMAPEDDPQTRTSWEKLPNEFRKTAKVYKITGRFPRGKEETVKKENLRKIIKDIV